MNKKEAIIIDLDGTLANCDHRKHFVDGTHDKQDWRSFYESMTEDTVNKWCNDIIYSFGCREEKTLEIIFVSGRPQEYKEITINWLRKHKITYGCEILFMRKTGDYRCDTIIKEEIYKEHIEPYYNILFIIDDRKKVVQMWRRLGLVCLHCADGEF